jgi:hypothetical protein
MGQQLKPLADVCRAKNCTPVLIHHTKRTSDTVRNNEPLGLEDISWSGFAEFARQWILINRRERYREGSGEHRLWGNYGGSAGHSGLWAVDIQEGQNTAAEGRTYTVAVQEARVAREAAQAEREDRRRQQAESKQAATLSNKVERVRKVLKVNDGLTQRQIREAAGLSNTNVVEALNLLIDRGEVVREVDTVRGQERSIFRKVQG